VVGFTFAALGAAAVIVAIARSRPPSGVTAMQHTAASLAAAPLAGRLPFGADAPSRLFLASMHLIAGTTFMPGLQPSQAITR
jgi:Family of unknown function (DUF6069)